MRILRAVGTAAVGVMLALVLLVVFGNLAQPEPPNVAVPLEHVSSWRVMEIPVAQAAAPTEMSYLWTTGGAGDGSATYTRVDWSNILKAAGSCSGDEGVGIGALNELAGTAGTEKVTLNTGYALVDGKPYVLSVAGDMAIPSAVGAGNTRIDRVVLRANWTAQTVRATVVSGIDAASPTVPAISTTSGSTYDVLLYQALVDTSGVVTATDERNWCTVPLLSTPITRTQSTGRLTIQPLGITGAMLAADSVDADKAGIRVPQFYQRQGGSATVWSTVGTTDYWPTMVRMQAGIVELNNEAGVITYPTAFSYAPLVWVLGQDVGPGYGINFSYTTTAIALTIITDGKNEYRWLAIGPE